MKVTRIFLVPIISFIMSTFIYSADIPTTQKKLTPIERINMYARQTMNADPSEVKKYQQMAAQIQVDPTFSRACSKEFGLVVEDLQDQERYKPYNVQRFRQPNMMNNMAQLEVFKQFFPEKYQELMTQYGGGPGRQAFIQQQNNAQQAAIQVALLEQQEQHYVEAQRKHEEQRIQKETRITKEKQIQQEEDLALEQFKKDSQRFRILLTTLDTNLDRFIADYNALFETEEAINKEKASAIQEEIKHLIEDLTILELQQPLIVTSGQRKKIEEIINRLEEEHVFDALFVIEEIKKINAIITKTVADLNTTITKNNVKAIRDRFTKNLELIQGDYGTKLLGADDQKRLVQTVKEQLKEIADTWDIVSFGGAKKVVEKKKGKIESFIQEKTSEPKKLLIPTPAETIQEQTKPVEITQKQEDVAYLELQKLITTIQQAPRITPQEAQTFTQQINTIAGNLTAEYANNIEIAKQALEEKVAETQKELDEQQKQERMQQLLKDIRSATQAITKRTGILIADELNKNILAMLDEAQRLDPTNTELRTAQTEASIALSNHFNVAVRRGLLEDEQNLTTLHTQLFAEPFSLENIRNSYTDIMQRKPLQACASSLKTLHDHGLDISLDTLHDALAYTVLIFDAFMASICTTQKVDDALGDTGTIEETYIPLLETASELFENDIITLFWKHFGSAVPSKTRAAYTSSDFDPTFVDPDTLLPGDEPTYLYAAPKEFSREGLSVTPPAIEPQHKKEYRSLINAWKDTVAQANNTKSLTQEAQRYGELSIDQLENERKKLDEAHKNNDINQEQYEDLQEKLSNATTELKAAQKQLDDLFAAFKKQIEQATANLKNKKITLVDFATPYTTIQDRFKTYTHLKDTYKAQFTEMINLFRMYVLRATEAMINISGLNTLHTAMNSGTAQARQQITNILYDQQIGAIKEMLDQLENSNLFGSDTDKTNAQIRTALVQGFGYILVAYDALFATLYEGRDDLWSWVQSMLTPGAARKEQVYDQAMEALTYVMKHLDQAQRLYYAAFIEPFAPNSAELYTKGIFDVMQLGLTGITTNKGVYLYARSGTTTAYKQQATTVPAIDSKHKKEYKKIADQWRSTLSELYKTETIAETKQAARTAINQELNRQRITMADGTQITLANIHQNNLLKIFSIEKRHEELNHMLELIGINMRQQLPLPEYGKNHSFAHLAALLKVLKDTNQLTPDIQRPLEAFFMALLGIYDATWAHVYDSIVRYNKATKTPIKKQILADIFAMIYETGKLCVEAIEQFLSIFGQYMGTEFINAYRKGELQIGTSIKATTYDDSLQHNVYIYERPVGLSTRANTAQIRRMLNKLIQTGPVGIEEGMVTLTVGNASVALIVPQNHQKLIKKYLTSWVPVLENIYRMVSGQPTAPIRQKATTRTESTESPTVTVETGDIKTVDVTPETTVTIESEQPKPQRQKIAEEENILQKLLKTPSKSKE